MKKTEYGIVYETLDELLDSDCIEIAEDDDFYYFRVKPETHYDNSSWKVNKNNRQVSYGLYTELFISNRYFIKSITKEEIKKII